MDSDSLPVLLEDGSRFDWQVAEYLPDVRVEPTRAVVRHALSQAPTLARLVANGRARWATEIRCPKTLYSRVLEASGTNQEVNWTTEEVDGDMFVIPGLVAVEDFGLEPEPGELSPIWPTTEMPVARGWWLARGAARRTMTLGQSLIQFVRSDSLDSGRMKIERSQSDEELRFHVHLAADIWEERNVRHVQMAALIGAFGQLGTAFGDTDDLPRIAEEIKQRLQEANVPTWADDTYDPAWAATAIERFHPMKSPSQDDR